jgi:endonuclease/exonuclease/phosphatase family metal-dependent hydrolase
MKKLIIFLFCIIVSMATMAQSLKIMTYNIRLAIASDGENNWQNRKDYFNAQIQFYEPDILGVQEAVPQQVIDLNNALTQYDNVGMGRDGIGKGESSNIYFKRDRFQCKESGTFWLSPTPDTISKGWDAAYNRVCTYALFKDKKTKKKFWVFNTHLDHVGEEAKSKGLQLIVSKMGSLNAKGFPVILMGDFNSEPETSRIKDLKEVMNDSRDISKEKPFGPSGTFNAFKHNEPVTRLIDYIFVSKSGKIVVKKYAILSDSKDLRYPSDHLPVYVELKFK